MGLTRHNAQSLGFMVAQAHDVDFMGVDYDHSNRPINFAGRHTIVVDDDGIPAHRQVDLTAGPIGQWILIPGAGGDSGRTLGQWGQVFPAKIYDTDPLTAGVILNQAGDFDTTLAGVFVATIDGTTPAIDTTGIIVAGSSLAGQELIFVAGTGSAGVTEFPARIVSHTSGAYYAFEQVDPFDNSTLGGGITGTAKELDDSTVIDTGEIVVVKTGGVYGAAYYFWFPEEDCP